MAAVGIWGIASFAKGGVLGGSIGGAFLIGQILAIAQSSFGVFLYIEGFRPATSVHYLYGATAVLALPFIWSYTKERHPRQGLLLFSIGALFVAGLAIRGMTTG
jgi:hypothetical protein